MYLLNNAFVVDVTLCVEMLVQTITFNTYVKGRFSKVEMQEWPGQLPEQLTNQHLQTKDASQKIGNPTE